MILLATAPSNKSFSLSRSTPMPDLKDYMTTKEAADKLGYHVVTIHKMIQKKKLESIKFGNTQMISREPVGKYLKETKGMSKNDPRRGKAEV